MDQFFKLSSNETIKDGLPPIRNGLPMRLTDKGEKMNLRLPHAKILIRSAVMLATLWLLGVSATPLHAACNATTCPDGCCFGLFCRTGTDDKQCGTGGAACENCASAGQTCGWEQACLTCDEYLKQDLDLDPVTGILSTKFMEEYADYDAYSAEDFTVPEGVRWVIDRFDFNGIGTDGGNPDHATGFHVLLYRDEDSHPAGYPGSAVEPVWSDYWPYYDPRISFDRDYHNGITLFATDTASGLPPGHYWVMLYLDWVTWETDVFWYWALSAAGGGTAAMYINPGGGWGVGTDWMPVHDVASFSNYELGLTLSNCGTPDDGSIPDDDADDDTATDDDDATPTDDDNDDTAPADDDDDDAAPTDNDDDNDDNDDDSGCGC